MNKPARQNQRPIDDVLSGSLADLHAGRTQDFDAFLAEMSKAVQQRADEIEADAMTSPINHSDP